MSGCTLRWNIPYGAQVREVTEHHRRWSVVKEGSGLEAYISFQKDPKQTDIWRCPCRGKKRKSTSSFIFFRKLEKYIHLHVSLSCVCMCMWGKGDICADQRKDGRPRFGSQAASHCSAHLASAPLIMQRCGCQNPKSSSPHTSLRVFQHQVRDVSDFCRAGVLFAWHWFLFNRKDLFLFLPCSHNEVSVFAYVSSGWSIKCRSSHLTRGHRSPQQRRQPALIFYWCSFKVCELLSGVHDSLLTSLHIQTGGPGREGLGASPGEDCLSQHLYIAFETNLLKKAVLFIKPVITGWQKTKTQETKVLEENRLRRFKQQKLMV